MDINQNTLRDQHAEQVVLSGLLNDNSTEIEISEFLKPSHFSNHANRILYEKIIVTIREGSVASFATIRKSIRNNHSINLSGEYESPEAYLKDLEDAHYTKKEAISCAKIVYNWAMRRSIYEMCSQSLKEVNEDLEQDPRNLIISIEKKISDLSKGNILDDYQSVSEIGNEVIEKISNKGVEGGSIIISGIKSLDNFLGGFHPSDLIIIAARPGMGKTSLALHIAKMAANNIIENSDEGAIGFFSLEMSSEQIFSKLISTETSAISSHKIRTGNISATNLKKHLIPAANKISKLPIYIDSSPSLDVFDMYVRAKKMKRQKNIKLLIVDYLQLMSASKDVIRYRNRVQEVSEISSGLKSIAKELDIPVIAISQLSRSLEQREDKKPMLSDLRESGSIEQDADIVMFLYREEYYLSKKAPEKESSEEYLEWQEKMADVKGIAKILISKNRYGPTSSINTLFDPERSVFTDV